MKKAKQTPVVAGALVVRGGAPAGYRALLDDLKTRVRAAQLRAGLAVNRELIQLYWDIGRAIVLNQHRAGWGAGVVDRLSQDIQRSFPGMEGFSRSNISRMRAFYLAWADGTESSAQPVPKSASGISAQPVPKLVGAGPPAAVAQIPWGHNVLLLFQLNEPTARLWYAQQATANGWSRSMLEHWIESDLLGRQGKAITNFSAALPPAQSDLAQQILKDPYNFDFLTLHEDATERHLELGLLDQITRFLLELGAGFAFVGRQVHIEVDGRDFSLDLLFYHLRLRCFVVVDLKTREYATKLMARLPGELAGKLPTVRQIETELTGVPRKGGKKMRQRKKR